MLKPPVGSWGRLLARVNDRDAAEAIIEHKEVLGGINHHIFYIQEYIEKPARDIRAFVVGSGTNLRHLSQLAALDHQHGARRSGVQLPGHAGIADLCQRSALAVSGGTGGILAIDMLEDPQRGFLVNEVNHTMEFRNSIDHDRGQHPRTHRPPDVPGCRGADMNNSDPMTITAGIGRRVRICRW